MCCAVAVWPHSVCAQGYDPEVAAQKMTTLPGLRVQRFASEPHVRQPILTKVDDRGRLWTIQYLQYPNPAGLKRISVDRWSRTVYDRVPKPPPEGPRGADRITIIEDTDGDGQADGYRDFVSGLNLATGLAFGDRGVYVLQVPYLLFYPDRDRDDVPDSDSQVLLTGFGMEDAQSLANHLTWGPDGWLYGVNGSTTTCRIRGIEFQQGVWRYHPRRDEFELFCEGGGNTFGVTFDQRGQLFYSTNGGPFVHAMQGAYYRKSFGKHGPLHNLYAYGFFDVVPRDQVPGGPPTGGTVYLGDSFPEHLRGTFIAGNFLGHTASWWNVEPVGSSFIAKYGGVLLDSHDSWFGPTDMCLGPAGEMYISDFHDQRTAHPDPDARWDRSNGRIFKISAANSQPAPSFNIAELNSQELVDLLAHSNRWFADRARVEIATRRDPLILPRLRTMALGTQDELLALQGVWALHAGGGLDSEVGLELIDSQFASVRFWTVRLFGDRREVSPAIAAKLRQLAVNESDPVMRCQLAATARRLPAGDGIEIITRLMDAIPNDSDGRTPLMIWWAIEEHAISGMNLLLAKLAHPEQWSQASSREQLKRLVRRWAAAGSQPSYAAVLKLIETAPADDRRAAFESLSMGLSERAVQLGQIEQGGLFESFAEVTTDGTQVAPAVAPIPPALIARVVEYWKEAQNDDLRLRLALQCEVESAAQHLTQRVIEQCRQGTPSIGELQLLGEFGSSDCVPALLKSLRRIPPPDRQPDVVSVLSRFRSPEITRALLQVYPQLAPAVRSQVIDVLLRRPDSAAALVQQVAVGAIAKSDVTYQQLRNLALHDNDQLDRQARELWGRITPGTTEEKLATMRRYNNDLRAGTGDPERGKPLFGKHCGTCHVLYGEGTKLGPELTTANRLDRAALLANIVDPSAVVKREYISYSVLTEDGRVIAGLLADQNAAAVTLLNAKNERIKIPREQIEEMREMDVSLMPERILQQLSPQELRDLFAYMQSR